MNIATLLTRSAAAYGCKIAVRHGAERLTYAELSDRASRFGSRLRALGLAPGDRVALWMKNSPEYAVALFGAFRAGLVAVPVNARLHPSELDYILAHCGARALVLGADQPGPIAAAPGLTVVVAERGGTGANFEELLAFGDPHAPDMDVDLDDVAWLFYTSGTTGRPKGAMLSHRNLLRTTVSCLAEVCSFRPEDVVLHLAPLSHGSGLYLIPALARGAENVIFAHTRFDANEALATIERERVTVIPFVAPTMVVMLVATPPGADVDSLRTMIYGGGPMHLEHVRAALERFGTVLVQLYGQGEAPMTISTLRADDHLLGDEALTSAGLPRTDVEVKIVDVDDLELPVGEAGEVAVRGDVVMRGYWADAAATAETLRGGWLHTGDIGRFGPDGRLYLLDRKGDVIITGGTNVYPREVEDVLLLHPSVLEAVACGVPDPIWGERVAAAVVTVPGSRPTAAEIAEHCRAHIAGFKKPTRIAFLDELPKNAYGKVLRREMRDHLAAEQQDLEPVE
jgi:acyl-CoA synthetase (AMP-forming)/AMP-acid ligase II